MARYCTICNNKLGIFHRQPICSHCTKTKYSDFFIDTNIKTLPDLPNKELDDIKKFNIEKITSLYDKLLEYYTDDNIMTETEITNLAKISNHFNLTSEQNRHDDTILPHKVKNHLNKNGHLPKINNELFIEFNLNFDKENLYNCGYCELYTMKSYSRYVPGYRGVSIYGFKVGRVPGQRVSEKLPTKKSGGKFIITDKGFYYVPSDYGNMVKIPHNKILNCGGDEKFLHIYKNGRQSPYLFAMTLGNIKINLLGLDVLRNNAN